MNHAASFRRVMATLALLAAAAVLLPGCGSSYRLKGKVVRGQASGIELIHEIDPRIKGPGLANVEVMVRRDPKSIDSRLAGHERTGESGKFSMGVSGFGAGWMEEQWLVQAGASGYLRTQQVMKLPSKGSKWQLLITLAPGESMPLEQTADYMQDFERFR